jgi:hypothetical protein
MFSKVYFAEAYELEAEEFFQFISNIIIKLMVLHIS